jgi:hypothetical protein
VQSRAFVRSSRSARVTFEAMRPGALLLHRRQIVAGPEAFAARPDWRSVTLGRSTVVSHCPDLRATRTRDASGTDWLLLGLAVQSLEGAPDPIKQIESARSEDVPALYASWAGRWLLIGDDSVHLDASGQIGCFYGVDSGGRSWASSSPALLAEAVGPGRALPADPRELRYDHGFSWYVLPRSRLEGTRQLLPSQVLDMQSGAPKSRPLLPPIDPDRGYDETLELAGSALVTALRRLPASPHPLWLSLTAGLDSRLVLAAAEAAGVRYVPYTRIAARMSIADRLIPPQLAEALGRELQIHRRPGRQRGRAVRERWELVLAHSGGHVSEGDAQPLLYGARDTLEGISLGGWLFGIINAQRRDLPPSIDDPAAVAREVARDSRESEGSRAEAALREWLEWVVSTPHEHLDWRDRMTIEQRMAGWQSSKEQVYDLARLERFPVVNAARSYSLFLEIDEGRRSSRQHQRDLVEHLCPALAGFPANPPDRHFGRRGIVRVKLRDDPVGLARRSAAATVRMAREGRG